MGILSDNDLLSNQIEPNLVDDKVDKDIEPRDNSPAERPEVRMRGQGPVRKYSQKTASFRWSGAEMIQIDGPQCRTDLAAVQNQILNMFIIPFYNQQNNTQK